METERKMYELTEEEKTAPITKEIGRACQHRLERRWYRRLIEINILLIVVVVGVFIANFTDYKDLANQAIEQFEEEMEKEQANIEKKNTKDKQADKKNSKDNNKEASKNGDSNSDTKEKLTEDDIPIAVQLLFYGIVMLVVGYLALYYVFAYYRSMSLRITEKNFPEIYEIIEQYANRLGIAVPKAYVMQSNGVLNAFSTFLFKKQWIVIHSELFEVAYREYKDIDSLSFIIAHEMAHIYYGHATLHYNIPIWFSHAIPLFGAIASRTREYSCDRLAQRLTGIDGVEAMLTLVVDRHLYKMVDKEDYIEQMKNQKGFFLWVVNMFADHPVMSKRVTALVEGKGSGAVY